MSSIVIEPRSELARAPAPDGLTSPVIAFLAQIWQTISVHRRSLVLIEVHRDVVFGDASKPAVTYRYLLV